MLETSSKKRIINLSLVQLSVMWCNVQVRGLNKAVESSEMFTLQVWRVFFPIGRPISSLRQKSVNTRMPGAPEQWPSSQLGACCGGEGFVLWGCDDGQWWKKHPQRTA